MKFKNEEKLSFYPQCVLEKFMMASVVADKSVIVKVKLIVNFINEITNPPSNNKLATFFELNFEVCPKKVAI